MHPAGFPFLRAAADLAASKSLIRHQHMNESSPMSNITFHHLSFPTSDLTFSHHQTSVSCYQSKLVTRQLITVSKSATHCLPYHYRDYSDVRVKHRNQGFNSNFATRSRRWQQLDERDGCNLSQHGLHFQLLYLSLTAKWNARRMYTTPGMADRSWMLRKSSECFGGEQQFYHHRGDRSVASSTV
jgi:hypothetical protein